MARPALKTWTTPVLTRWDGAEPAKNGFFMDTATSTAGPFS